MELVRGYMPIYYEFPDDWQPLNQGFWGGIEYHRGKWLSNKIYCDQ
jgi:hypothetical protein